MILYRFIFDTGSEFIGEWQKLDESILEIYPNIQKRLLQLAGETHSSSKIIHVQVNRIQKVVKPEMRNRMRREFDVMISMMEAENESRVDDSMTITIGRVERTMDHIYEGHARDFGIPNEKYEIFRNHTVPEWLCKEKTIELPNFK